VPSIFISYSELDRDVATEIAAVIGKLGFERVFLDFDKDTGFGAGADWEKRLYEELSRCQAVILVLTPNWLASKWCFAELVQARALGKLILPIMAKPLGDRFVLPDIQAVALDEWNADGAVRLQHRLLDIGSELARGFPFDPRRPPYPGMHAFEVEDAAVYFGRDEETRAVIERLTARRIQRRARLLVVIGASGSGKSSLLNAGVLPQLACRRSEWIVLPTVRPEKEPVKALARAMGARLARPSDWQEWEARFASPAAAEEVDDLLKQLRVGDARAATVVLPIDQLDQVFTVATLAQRAAFLELMKAILDPVRNLPLIAIAAGDADVLEGLLNAGDLARLAESFPLLPMPVDRFRHVVEGPAGVAGLHVEEGLVEAITRDADNSESLPLLAFMLHLLYERCAGSGRLTLATYQALGDRQFGLNPIQNAVRLVGDRVIARQNPSQQELKALREAFVPHLVRVRLDDGERVRQPARWSELPNESLRLVRALVEARLLTSYVSADGTIPDGGGSVVQIAQKAALTAWPMLDSWLTQEHAFLTDLQRIRVSYRLWVEAPADQKQEAQLAGLLLARARDWLTVHPQRFQFGEMAELRRFVNSSIDAEHQKKPAVWLRPFSRWRSEPLTARSGDSGPRPTISATEPYAGVPARPSYERTTAEYWLHRVAGEGQLAAGDQPLVMISYATEDQKWVEDLRAYLDPQIELLQDPKRQEYRLWNFADAKRGTTPGDEFPEIVAEKMWRCRAALILLSRDYFKSQYCKIVELPFLMWRREHHALMCLPLRLGALPVNKVRLPSYEGTSRTVLIDDLIDDRQASPNFANSRYRDLNLKQLREDGKESEIEHRFDGVSRHVTEYLKTRYLAIEL
jgi:hypothetical protein